MPLLARSSARSSVLLHRSLLPASPCFRLVSPSLYSYSTRPHRSLLLQTKDLLTRDSLEDLYRGLAVPLVSQPLYIGACFAGVALGRQWYDAYLAPRYGGGGGEGGSMRRFTLASTIGAVVCAVAVTPGDRLKVTLQAETGGGSRHPLGALRDLVREGGPLTLFAGLEATILREIPGTMVWIGVFEAVAKWMQRSMRLGRAAAVAAGGIAGGAAFWLLTLPIDRIKTLQQVLPPEEAAEMLPLARKIWEREGIRGFYAGIQPVILRLSVDLIQFSTADALRRLIVGQKKKRRRQQSRREAQQTGAAAGGGSLRGGEGATSSAHDQTEGQ